MSISDFRQIAIKGEAGKGERLFRAAVTAFCSLTRPSRREIAQLEDLTLPLFDSVSEESLRYVAAALSENAFAPPALVRRLCEESSDIAAPLLMRSTVLRDVDLIALIGRHGEAHARAVALRSHLSPVIAGLVRAFGSARQVDLPEPEAEDVQAIQERAQEMPSPAFSSSIDDAPDLDAVEAVRERLRAMMRPEQADADTGFQPWPVDAYPKLRETALTGHLAFFQTALADTLDIDFRVAKAITEDPSYTPLSMALRSLEIGEERAFLLVAAIYPSSFGNTAAVRLFTERYRLIHPAAASERLRDWRGKSGDVLPATVAQRQAANHDVEDYDWSAETGLIAS